MNKVRYSDYVHPKFGRALLCDPIYYEDHSLETALKSLVPYSSDFSSRDFSLAKMVGIVGSFRGQKAVYRMVFDNGRIWYGLFERNKCNSNSTNIICGWEFIYDTERPLLPNDSFCKKEYQGQGLLSELFWFIAKNEHHSISSPIVPKYDTIKFWNALLHDFYVKHICIYHWPTKKTYTAYSAGKVIDGHYVIDPNQEKMTEYYHMPEEYIKFKEWFYVYKTPASRNSSEDRYLGPIQPYYKFGDGYE